MAASDKAPPVFAGSALLTGASAVCSAADATVAAAILLGLGLLLLVVAALLRYRGRAS